MRGLIRAALVATLVPSLAQSPAHAQPHAGQPVRIVGVVYDHLHRPIAGAEVLLSRTRLVAVSNAAGLFSLSVGAADSTIGFRRIGYRPLLVSLDPLPAPGDTVRVQLRPAPVELPEVTVSAPPTKPLRYAGTTKYDDVFHRRRIGLGTLITREMIDQRFGVSTAELLQGIAGVRYENGPPKRVRFSRCQDPGGIAVYVDGARMVAPASYERLRVARQTGRQSRGDENILALDYPEIEMLSRIRPGDVEMIEVYSGASQIPGVFHWNGCAVIALWTRWNR